MNKMNKKNMMTRMVTAAGRTIDCIGEAIYHCTAIRTF